MGKKWPLDSVYQKSNFILFSIKHLLDQLDLNGDGIITLGEYKIALGISTQPVFA